MPRSVRLLALALLVACHHGGGKGAGTDDPPTDDVSGGDVASSEGVKCPDILHPKKDLVCDGDTPVCCWTGQLHAASCAATAQACGNGNSHFTCDDATDCADGESCCKAELNTGMQTILTTCRKGCKLIEKPMCSGPGTCKEGQTCCWEEGDVWGTCVKEGTACPVETGFQG